ncbi:MMPL family transporter [Nocardia sp. NPDC127579]|uniref:MMPL family transporter n=1 Tax=Nocardia sp. NPDC127579 TaxID=3345402 RepID=UPI00363982CD
MTQVQARPERVESVPERPGAGHRWGAFVAAHWRLTLAVWALLLAACAVSVPALEHRLRAPDFSVDAAESAEARKIIARHFPAIGAEQDVIVFDSRDRRTDTADYQAVVASMLTEIRGIAGVSEVIGPFDGMPAKLVSDDKRTAIAIVGIKGAADKRSALAEDLARRAAQRGSDGIWVGVSGHTPMENDQVRIGVEDTTKAELIGMPVALLLLILSMGALVAASVPVGVALAGIAGAYGLIYLLSTLMHFDTLVLAVATMIGTGVGIDYSMFLVSRFREELAQSAIGDIRARTGHAVAVTMETTGRNILASGLIVMISLGALFVVRVPIFRAIAGGVAAAVTAALLVSLTLLPAVLAGLGPRINSGALPRKFLPPDASGAASGGIWARWAELVMRRPWLFATAALALLLISAAPLAGAKFGLDAGVAALKDQPSGRAAQVIEQKFASGLLAPVQVVATGPVEGALTAAQAEKFTAFTTKLQGDKRISAVIPETSDSGRRVATVILKVAFDAPEATDLVKSLRADAKSVSADGGPTLRVGGETAEYVDFSREIGIKSPWVFGLVLASSFVFLVIVFRSILLPVEAIVMNLIAIAAAMGITVAVFQWGLGESLLDFQSRGFVQVFLPTVVFAVLFGLSMDYEVFLIGRIKEIFDIEGDNKRAVAAGLAHTARPITTAAAIMVVVFGSFVTAHMLEDKQIGFALAVAVAIDAIIVRLMLVPALMQIFGRWNWWYPRFKRPKTVAVNVRESLTV